MAFCEQSNGRSNDAEKHYRQSGIELGSQYSSQAPIYALHGGNPERAKRIYDSSRRLRLEKLDNGS